MSSDDLKKRKTSPGDFPRVEQAGASDLDIERVHAVLMREKPEPTEGNSQIPMVLLFVFSVLMFWGGTYLTEHRANWDPLIYDYQFTGAPKATEAAAPLTADSPEWRRRGQRLYTANCVACHGADGRGQAGNFPPLAGSEWVIGPYSDKLLPKILLHGLVGPIVVMGNPYNGNMPAQSSYTDAQVAQVLTFIRTEWGNQGAPFTAEQIAEIRAASGRRGPWTGPEIKAAVGWNP